MQDQYESLYNNFRWHVPALFNIGHECCTKWSHDRGWVALYFESDDGHAEKFTFHELQQNANRLSNALSTLGVQRGDRVAILLPQSAETIIAHIAIYQIGAVAESPRGRRVARRACSARSTAGSRFAAIRER